MKRLARSDRTAAGGIGLLPARTNTNGTVSGTNANPTRDRRRFPHLSRDLRTDQRWQRQEIQSDAQRCHHSCTKRFGGCGGRRTWRRAWQSVGCLDTVARIRRSGRTCRWRWHEPAGRCPIGCPSGRHCPGCGCAGFSARRMSGCAQFQGTRQRRR